MVPVNHTITCRCFHETALRVTCMFTGTSFKAWLLRPGQESRLLVDNDVYDYNQPKPYRWRQLAKRQIDTDSFDKDRLYTYTFQ